MAYRILVVDDEKLIVKGIKFSLEQDGMEVTAAYDGEEALQHVKEGNFDLVVLDVMLPKMDGLEVCQQVREFSQIPIIMVTAKGEDMDKIMGLEYGADDYITKPFNPLELTARVKSQLRRYTELNPSNSFFENSDEICCHGLIINQSTHKVLLEEEEIKLTPLEFDILYLLASNAGKVFSTSEIFQRVWHERVYEANNTVMVHIRRLRSKIHDEDRTNKIITTVWGVGYKIEK